MRESLSVGLFDCPALLPDALRKCSTAKSKSSMHREEPIKFPIMISINVARRTVDLPDLWAQGLVMLNV